MASGGLASFRRQPPQWPSCFTIPKRKSRIAGDRRSGHGEFQLKQRVAFEYYAASTYLSDTDLSRLHDAAALAKLPAEEQKASTQLWADVATLLKKAEEKPK